MTRRFPGPASVSEVDQTVQLNDNVVIFTMSTLAYGKELWRSKKIADSTLSAIQIDVTDVQILTLKVEDAGNGNNSDWGVWADPKVER